MARTASTMDDILKKLSTLSKADRRKLLEELCADPDLREDLYDIRTLLQRKGEPTRPYDEFVQELKAEDKL